MGRKKVEDKKIQVYAQVRQSMVDQLGGVKAVRSILDESIQWCGRQDVDESALDIALDADMKIARYRYKGEIGSLDIMTEIGKAYVQFRGRRLWLSQFYRVNP